MAQGDHSAGILKQSMRARNRVVTEYPIPARFLAPKDCTKVPAQLWTLWFSIFILQFRAEYYSRGAVVWRSQSGNLVAQNETFRKQKPSEQSQFWLPNKAVLLIRIKIQDRHNGPQYKKKWGQSCFESAGFWFSLGRAEDFPGAWKSLTGGLRRKKI